MQAISHALLLAPQNPFHVVHFAETAFLVPDIPLALKMYLQAVDMTDEEEQDGVAPRDTVPTGLVVRAWFGVKLVRELLMSFVCRTDCVLPSCAVHTQTYNRASCSHHIAFPNASSNDHRSRIPGRARDRTTSYCLSGSYTRITAFRRQGSLGGSGQDPRIIALTVIHVYPLVVSCFNTLFHGERLDEERSISSYKR